jgi:hypothetical protein
VVALPAKHSGWFETRTAWLAGDKSENPNKACEQGLLWALANPEAANNAKPVSVDLY